MTNPAAVIAECLRGVDDDSANLAHAARIEARLRAAGLLREEWRPIAEAPRDRRFIGFRPAGTGRFDYFNISVCKYRKSMDGNMRLFSEADYEGLPFGDWTHWQPLPLSPAPPAAQEDEHGR